MNYAQSDWGCLALMLASAFTSARSLSRIALASVLPLAALSRVGCRYVA